MGDKINKNQYDMIWKANTKKLKHKVWKKDKKNNWKPLNINQKIKNINLLKME